VSSQKSLQRESDFFHDLFLELHSVRGVCGCSRRLGSCFGIDLLLFFGDHQTMAQNWICSRQSFVGTTGVRGFLNYTMILFIALTLTSMAEKKKQAARRENLDSPTSAAARKTHS
jgi:hypothetical protein